MRAEKHRHGHDFSDLNLQINLSWKSQSAWASLTADERSLVTSTDSAAIGSSIYCVSFSPKVKFQSSKLSDMAGYVGHQNTTLCFTQGQNNIPDLMQEFQKKWRYVCYLYF